MCCRFVAGGNPGDAADQLKLLVRELHRAGLEVLLEVRGGSDDLADVAAGLKQSLCGDKPPSKASQVPESTITSCRW